MKAVQINRYGGYDALQVNDNVPEPALKPNQVLVKVHASSINPYDSYVIKGFAKDYQPLTFPATMGNDFSGVITELAPGVIDFKVGDEVYGSAIVFNGSSGAYADLAAVNTKNIALKPTSVDFIQAASLPLVGVTAIQAIVETIKLRSGQKILIHGGAGGIGSVAIQLAKSLGAYVATSVSTKDLDYAKSLGADEVIDYKTQKFEEILKDFDAVFDTIGSEVTDRSFKVLKKGGILASMKGEPSIEMATQYGVTGVAVNTINNGERLKKLTRLVEQGVVKPQIGKVFPIDQIKEAFIFKEVNHPEGKVVITIV